MGIILVIIMVFGICPTNGPGKVNAATKVINASDIAPLITYKENGESTYGFDLSEDTILNMDQDLEFFWIRGYGYSLTIKGKAKLETGSITKVNNYIQEENTRVYLTAGIKDCENITLCKGSELDARYIAANKTIDMSGDYISHDVTESKGISAQNVIIRDGQTTLQGFKSIGIYASQSIQILGGITEIYFNINGTGSWNYVKQGIKKVLLSPSIVIGEDVDVLQPSKYEIIDDYTDKTITGEAKGSVDCFYVRPKAKQEEKGSDNSSSSSSDSSTESAGTYSNEWVNGKWYNADGSCTYSGTLVWKNNSTGWWVEDSEGWYPQSSWQKIDGVWYYFASSGYMANSEWYDGYWLNGDGSLNSTYKMTWKGNSTGWWIEDISGWWPSNCWQKIDGSWYYFDGSGYMVTNRYVDGYWIGSDGVCQ